MSKKLLLADDSITIQKVIGITFANEDYELTVVDNGDAALEKARSEHPDLILADVFMPGKNGYELCAAVHQDPQLQGIPVLLLTGTFEPFDEDKALASGAGGWIAKPFESQALIDRVEELLAKGGQPQPAAPAAEAEEWAPFTDSEDFAADAGAGFGAQETTFAPEQEDIWGEAPPVAEEPEGPAAPESIEEEIWGEAAGEEESADEELFFEEPAAESGAPAEPAWEEEEILALDEDDILDEEDLEILDEGEPGAFVAEEPVSDVGQEATVGEESAGAAEDVVALEQAFPEEDELAGAFAPVEEGKFTAAEAGEKAEEELVEASETAFAAEFTEPEVAETSPVADFGVPAEEEEPFSEEFGVVFEDEEETAAAETPLEFSESPSFTDEEPEWGEPGDAVADFGQPPVAAEPEPVAPEVAAVASVATENTPQGAFVSAAFGAGEETEPPVAAAVEERVQSLSEADLEKIVERVAGSVVDKLAGSILERIAWEVVPDLAESLIRDEIRKIKEAVRD